MISAQFTVVSHHSVRKANGSGYSWGILLVGWTQSIESEQIYLCGPIKRKNVHSLQQIDGEFLDSFKMSNHRIVTDSDLKLFRRLQTWTVLVLIPKCLFDEDNIITFPEDISIYLRSHIDGKDDDTTIYEVPNNLGEMEYDPHEYDKTQIRV